MMELDINKLLNDSFEIISESGKYAQQIRKDIYKNGFLPFDLDEIISVTETPAENEDFLMSDFLHKKIRLISDFPIISEEYHTRLTSDTFWCIDPLDGSFCFSHDTGPYSILISLIYRGKPVIGLACFPEQNIIYAASSITGSYFVKESKKKTLKYSLCSKNLRGIITNASPDPEPIKQYLRQFNITKFTETLGAPNPALILSGQGDIMPLFHRQYEWDIAAYDAILRYAHKSQTPVIVDMYGKPVTYGKQDTNRPFENPKLIATYNKNLITQICNNTKQKEL
ncbi:MAG: hypothetical protein J6Y07_01440 [Alphaproteobacteria bacterium]|nr:hypothetical protein [Alphaproteobacteria bacterium]